MTNGNRALTRICQDIALFHDASILLYIAHAGMHTHVVLSTTIGRVYKKYSRHDCLFVCVRLSPETSHYERQRLGDDQPSYVKQIYAIPDSKNTN